MSNAQPVATDGQARPAPPRVVPPPQESGADVPGLIGEMEAWFTQLKRATAAYSSLDLSYLSAIGQLPPGERRRGLPIFEFSAPSEGKETREVVKCVIDLKKIDPAYLGHVLVPIINATAADFLDALNEIGARVEMLRPLLTAVARRSAPRAESAPEH